MSEARPDPSTRFVSSKYAELLDELEALDFRGADLTDVREGGRLASVLKKVLADSLLEGYEDFVSAIERKTDASPRLDRILHQVFERIGDGKSERELYCLTPHAIDIPAGGADEWSEPKELVAWLGTFEDECLRLPSSDSLRVAGHEAWEAQARLLHDEIVRFMQWIVGQTTLRGGLRLVFLLRDMLLPYLGFRLLQRTRADLDATALLVGRTFMEQFTAQPGSEALYHAISDVIYRALDEEAPASFEALRGAFRRGLDGLCQIDEEVDGLVRAARSYTTAVLGERPHVFIESGATGSVPLLLGAVNEHARGHLMYATYPWLRRPYGERIFTTRYHYLMDIEMTVAHDGLLRFSHFEGDRVFVRVCESSLVERLVRWQTASFLEAVRKAFAL
ncbi:MAG: hypothetical protein U0270_45335 [Labilithrix sp.]